MGKRKVVEHPSVGPADLSWDAAPAPTPGACAVVGEFHYGWRAFPCAGYPDTLRLDAVVTDGRSSASVDARIGQDPVELLAARVGPNRWNGGWSQSIPTIYATAHEALRAARLQAQRAYAEALRGMDATINEARNSESEVTRG